MSDFKSLLAEFAQGNVSIETVRSWIDDALAEGDASSDELNAQLQAVSASLPSEAVATLRESIASGDAALPSDDAPLEFEFDTELPKQDAEATVAEPVEQKPFDGNFELEPMDEQPADDDRTVVDSHAAGGADKTRVIATETAGGGDKTEVVARTANDGDKTEIVNPATDRTEVVADHRSADATVVSGNDPTIRGGGEAFDPFAVSESTQPAGVSTPTGTGWPTNTNFTGRSSGLDPRTIGPGTILKERFELLSAIGEGGMGMVYKARDLLKVEAKDRNPYIAVKLLSGDFREHPEAFIALQRESSKAQKLAHPNITTVYDFDRDGSTVYLTMELMEGEELAKYIKKLPAGGLPAEEALSIVKQLCDGLEYAHVRNLVHSDFKPGNCFYLRDGTVKILDFGIARASTTRADAQGETTVFDPGQLGALTPAYATPEMFEGMEPDPRDDIYALACVAYELLTGKHPFNKLSSVKAMEKGLSPAPITNKAGFTKRQQKALFKALAFKREDRTASVPEFWEGIRFKKNYVPYYVAAGIAGLLLLSAGLYRPVVETLEDRKNAEIVSALESNQMEVPQVLASLDQFSERARRNLLESGRDIFISHYQQRAEAKVDESQGRYDYPAAFKEIAAIRQYYPDSAQVQTLDTELRSQQNTLISQLNDRFNAYLEEDRLLPIEGEDDITDVLARLRQAAPNSALLQDARLSSRYAALVQDAVMEQNWDRAARYLETGLAYAPADAQLLNLDDEVKRELKRQADAKLVADIKARLAERRNELNSVEGFAASVDDLIKLGELRPEDSQLNSILSQLQRTVSSHLEELTAAGSYARAEEILFTFARLFPVSRLLDMREALSRAEVSAGYQPEDLGAALAALNERRNSLQQLLSDAKFDNEWNNALAKEFKEAIALLRPGNTWFEDLRQKIVTTHVQQAEQLVSADRFDAARRVLDSGEAFHPEMPLFAEQRSALDAAKAEFDREQEARVRLARLDALKNTLVTQANANEVASATRTLESLRQELGNEDSFVATTGPNAIAEAYLRLANTQAERENFTNAMSFARKGLEFAPDMQGLKAAAADFANRAKREELQAAASNATLTSLRQLPQLLGEVQKLFPSDASAIANEAISNLGKRIKSLEATDVTGANDLLAEAKKLFPGNRVLEGISLRQPPRPSQYVPAGREAMNRNQLTAADKVLATAQREEPGHEQVKAFAKELLERKDQANKYFLYYQQLQRQGQKSQAKPYLDEALRLWVDNEQYQKELDANYTTTRAPTRAADGSRACTASLAGYGRSGRAVCYDMVGDNMRGPELVVVPAGGAISQPFAIGKYEVSVGDFNNYCNATGKCAASSANPELPATRISYQDMQSYVQWLTQTTGAQYRIPTESEWVYAATAGNANAVKDFNCRVTQGGQILKGLTMLEVKSGRTNPWGLTNYVGNAQELVRTAGGVSARGGAFQDNLSACDIQLTRKHAGTADDVTGFRVAKNLD